jgi:hypothetical protein
LPVYDWCEGENEKLGAQEADACRFNGTDHSRLYVGHSEF